jgi:hypothetical protein
MATILKLAIKNIYPNYQHYTDIDPSVPDLIFPVYKIDREQSWKKISKEHLKIPKRYSEAIVFENCLKDDIFLYDKGPLYCASVIIA